MVRKSLHYLPGEYEAEAPTLSVTLLAQEDTAETANGEGGKYLQAQSPYNGSFLLCLLSLHNILPCQQQAPTGSSSSVAFQKHCKGLALERALGMHSPWQSWRGLRNSPNYFVFLVTDISFLFIERGARTLCLFFLVIFTKNEVMVPFCLRFVSNTSPSLLLLFFSSTLFSQYRIISSMALGPTGSPRAESKNSRSVDSWSAVPVHIYSACLIFAFPLMLFLISISFPPIC